MSEPCYAKAFLPWKCGGSAANITTDSSTTIKTIIITVLAVIIVTMVIMITPIIIVVNHLPKPDDKSTPCCGPSWFEPQRLLNQTKISNNGQRINVLYLSSTVWGCHLFKSNHLHNLPIFKLPSFLGIEQIQQKPWFPSSCLPSFSYQGTPATMSCCRYLSNFDQFDLQNVIRIAVLWRSWWMDGWVACEAGLVDRFIWGMNGMIDLQHR